MALREVKNTVIEVGRSVKESLADILILKLRILLAQLLPILVEGRQFHETSNGQTHVAHARLAVHASRINSHAIKHHRSPRSELARRKGKLQRRCYP